MGQLLLGEDEIVVMKSFNVTYLSNEAAPEKKSLILVGPETLKVVGDDAGDLFMSYRLFTNVSDDPGETDVPQNAVVIPADGIGSVDIRLESSEDMVNWTTIAPGTFGATTAKRFFRVRAITN